MLLKTEDANDVSIVTTRPNLPAWKLSIKRGIDVVGSTSALLLLSPLLFLIALLVYASDGKPIFYRWHVVGKGGIPFISWKYRTMVRNADALKSSLLATNEMSGPVFKMRDDPRITRLGRILRRFSLDELPQLWSVLKGDMSLVGPRPPLIEEYARFNVWQRQKLVVIPGMTCLWQISGRNEIRDFDDWVRMDLQYIEQWSIMEDFRIMLRTVRVVMGRRGAY